VVMQSAPDIVVVVADCLRQDELERLNGSSSLLSDLRHEAVVFARCSSVSNWTVPAHASILTGRYPFEHNMHRFGVRALPGELPSISTTLGALGYATQILSANHFIRPDTGFANGFDQFAFGTHSETSFRTTSPIHPPHDSGSLARGDKLGKYFPDNGATDLSRLARHATDILPRFPWILDVVSRAYSGVFGEGPGKDYRVAPWLEASFRRFVEQTPRSRPILSFMNLMDCHEPYLPEPSEVLGLSHWMRLATARQDFVSWARGRWLPSQSQLDRIKELYRQKIRRIALRIEQLVGTLREAGRWEDTLFILLGDHGQAFGEHGQLFHGGELFEPCIHVPLWIRFPRGQNGGEIVTEQASLVDVFPTIMGVVDPSCSRGWSGVPLCNLLDSPRPNPVCAVADGVTGFGSISSLSTGPRQFPQVALYADRFKLIIDYPSGRTEAYQLQDDPLESTNLWPAMSDTLQDARKTGLTIGARMLPNCRGPDDTSVTHRLSRWGYLD
jgi:arylsulfatase A-like enzyme